MGDRAGAAAVSVRLTFWTSTAGNRSFLHRGHRPLDLNGAMGRARHQVEPSGGSERAQGTCHPAV